MLLTTSVDEPGNPSPRVSHLCQVFQLGLRWCNQTPNTKHRTPRTALPQKQPDKSLPRARDKDSGHVGWRALLEGPSRVSEPCNVGLWLHMHGYSHSTHISYKWDVLVPVGIIFNNWLTFLTRYHLILILLHFKNNHPKFKLIDYCSHLFWLARIFSSSKLNKLVNTLFMCGKKNYLRHYVISLLYGLKYTSHI